MVKLLIFVLCAAVSAASVVPFTYSGVNLVGTKGMVTNVTRCGGVAAFIQLRVSDCEGSCTLNPGTKYDIETDLIPANAFNTCNLNVKANVFGTDLDILDTELPYPGAQPGQMITIAFSLTPNDILSGNSVRLTATITNNFSGNLELCYQTDVYIT